MTSLETYLQAAGRLNRAIPILDGKRKCVAAVIEAALELVQGGQPRMTAHRVLGTVSTLGSRMDHEGTFGSGGHCCRWARWPRVEKRSPTFGRCSIDEFTPLGKKPRGARVADIQDRGELVDEETHPGWRAM